MLNEIHFKTDHTHTGGNVYQCVILFFFFFLNQCPIFFRQNHGRIVFTAVGQTFLGLKELFYSLFEDFREKLVYAKIDQL